MNIKSFFSPVNLGLIAIIAFVAGLIAFRTYRSREGFDQWSIPMTVVDFARSPSKLPVVVKQPLVTDHDYFYDRFGG